MRRPHHRRRAGLSVVETGWAKNRIRDLLVRQANEYLTATLTIGRLEGSLLRGIAIPPVLLRQADEGIECTQPHNPFHRAGLMGNLSAMRFLATRAQRIALT